MAQLNNAEKESFSAQVAGILAEQETTDALKAADFDPTKLAKEIADGIESLPALNAATLKAKNAYEKALAAENAVRDKAYEKASGGVDTSEGLLGKKHPIAKKLRAIRGIMNPQKPKKPAPPK